MSAAAHVCGVVTCTECGSPLHLACPTHGAGAEYQVEPLRKYRPPPKDQPYKVRPTRYTKAPCVACQGPVEITGKGRPHQRCLKCRGV